jgi:hypothetical protein
VVFVALVLLALAISRPLARRLGCPVWVMAATLLSAAVVLSLTLPPAPGHPVDGPAAAALADCLRAFPHPGGWWRALVSTDDRGERVGNVAMLVPVSLFAVLATRRPVRVALVGALAPVAIELSQALIGAGRDCLPDDWINNATGALLGAAAGALALRLMPRLMPRLWPRLTQARPSSRSSRSE